MIEEQLLSSIRVVPDYPKKGILFRDITTLLNDRKNFALLIDHLKKRYEYQQIDFVAGLESRGFMFGAPLAYALGVGFVPIRKKGKLPYKKLTKSYELEYGEDEIEIHLDAFRDKNNPKVILIDDLIATGGTALAGAQLIQDLGGQCIEACFLIDLEDFGGSKMLKSYIDVYSILKI